MYKVKFIKDFATKKENDILECDGQLASHLVHVDKVAVYLDSEVVETKTKTKK